jgi:hypothetical protein
MKTISFGGQLACGKDTAADYLAEILDSNWQRAALASAVKKVFMDTFQVDMEFIEKWKRIKESPPGFSKPVRQSLQFIGDGFRQIQGNIWIDLAFREEIDRIVSDVRYVNEIVKVKSINGIICLIWRPGHENSDPNGSEAQIKPYIDFFSENGKEGVVLGTEGGPEHAEKVDLFLINDGTLEDFCKKVDDIVVPYAKEFYGI